MKDKVIVFGVGNQFKLYKNIICEKYEIIAYADNYVKDLDNTKVLPLVEVVELDFDKIIITPLSWVGMVKQCLDIGIKREKIVILDLIPELWQRTVSGVISFGQHFEDLIVLGIFGQIGITNPSYLDIGCNHPYKISNTALMYQGGAKGVNVDANKVTIEAFNHVRTVNTINLNYGVAPKAGILTFYMQSEDSGLNTFMDEEVEFAKSKFKVEYTKTEQIECKTLGDIINGFCDGEFPDYFDCDIEGLDYDVIDSYDMSINGPKVACVEVRPDEMERFDLLFDNYNYFCFCRIGGNSIYARNEYKKILTRITG